ncbi:AAA family ATPase [Comamonas testosteroni]|uniref:AAA family ATPase n=1 Tax=Comamonas testosteroni TaxID=285 RepID=UPI002DB6EEF0|nr:AAA family ATPase [Comamonas testosteroni]MEB5964228.1 AAA family ATPase [Comamonas testosteroni]
MLYENSTSRFINAVLVLSEQVLIEWPSLKATACKRGIFGNKTSLGVEIGAYVEGVSGSGKSEAILRCLGTYPQQVIPHKSFFKLAGGLQQVAWLSIDVPSSGRATDLAAALMTSWKKATNSTRFDRILAADRRHGSQMLEEWRQVASSHFLGLLHLDEIQNFFKLSTLDRRRKRKVGDAAPELSIVEDQCLKWILTLMNTWQIPLLVSGTPDGISALTRRLSNAQRIVTSGYHAFVHFTSATDAVYRRIFLRQLSTYQFVATPVNVTDELAQLIWEKTAGVQRLIIALWIAAHRVAFERKADDLQLDDFRVAADTYLSLVQPAVAALCSNDPQRLSRYEDLTPRDNSFWTRFWGEVSHC